MRLSSFTRLLAGVLLAACPSLSYSQNSISISPAIPQTGGTVTFQAPALCGGFWLVNGRGALGGAGGLAGGTFSTSIGSSSAYAGLYQITLDSGVGGPCPYLTQSFVVTQPGLSKLTGLSGYYTFLCHGRVPADQGGGMSAAIGTFAADGAGNLTGLLDYNSTAKTLVAQAITGTYSLDSTGTGLLTIKTPLGTTNYAVFVNPLQIGGGGPAYAAVMVEQDAGGGSSSCSASAAAPSPNTVPAYGWGQLLQLNGEADCPGACPGSRAFGGNALLSLSGDQTASSVSNISGPGFTIKNLNLAGQYTMDVTTG